MVKFSIPGGTVSASLDPKFEVVKISRGHAISTSLRISLNFVGYHEGLAGNSNNTSGNGL